MVNDLCASGLLYGTKSDVKSNNVPLNHIQLKPEVYIHFGKRHEFSPHFNKSVKFFCCRSVGSPSFFFFWYLLNDRIKTKFYRDCFYSFHQSQKFTYTCSVFCSIAFKLLTFHKLLTIVYWNFCTFFLTELA